MGYCVEGNGHAVKIKGVYKACMRAAMVYGGDETWAMRKEDEGVLQ